MLEKKREQTLFTARMSTNLSGLMHLLWKVKFLNAAVEGEEGAAQGVEAQLLQSSEARTFEAGLNKDT